MKKLKVAIHTFGCQMNEYDSQVAAGLLKAGGFDVVENGDSPPQKGQSPFSQADVVLMNTCSVREHAEDKVYSRLGTFKKIKKTNPNLIVGLMGCMVEEHREKLFKRFPELDFMIGTRNISELPSIIEDVRQNRKQVSKIKQDGISIEYTDLIQRDHPYYAWLPIMTGCDKVCTYCIVPITRGREVSMPAREVYREASRLVSEGVKWITLLGQNVNSYNGMGVRTPLVGARMMVPGTIPEMPRNNGDNVSFPDLLEMLCQIEGLERISFTTSHPHDATEELFQVIARNPKISRRFHLPLQSGSDRMLKRMKRLHTYADYKAKIDRMRELIPDIAVTTDIIAGFSGETEEDHQATVRALSEIRYDSAFIFKYSLRPGTPAAKLPDDVPLGVKGRRNQELLAVQRRITVEDNEKWLGKTVSVFVEEQSTKDPKNVIGRTDQDKKVIFEASPFIVGCFVEVELNDLYHETFIGTLKQPG